ncbi:MAG: threonylcarbamoyl-AMP synthase [Chloroflexi bacterium HGW-Chloroflexi-10]|nr:MAG: threonylcarbamoyl-AMP synthase [Chloroflexi bacterium HGW-Chloroflexi-10]
MRILNLFKNYQNALSEAEIQLSKGDSIVFPTDTVYGVAAKLADPEAVDRLFEIKGRDQLKAIAVLIGNMEQLFEVAAWFPHSAQKLVERFWPGGLTVVVQKKTTINQRISPDETVGVRIPDYEFVRELCLRCGPLAATSANISGQPSATNLGMVLAQLSGKVDLIIDGGETQGGVASTVLDCTNENIKLLREGAISRAVIEDFLGHQIKD